MNDKKNFRPRPIDINTLLPIITDPSLTDEIEEESQHYQPVLNQRKRKKDANVEEFIIPAFIPVNLPTPSFKDLEENKGGKKATKSKKQKTQSNSIFIGKRKKHFELPKEYIRYREKAENLIVEYDMDEEDSDFIWALNNYGPPPPPTPKKGPKATEDISEDQFETLIDIFEREAFYAKFSLSKEDSLFNYRYFSNTDDVPCCICGDIMFEDDNKIIFCEDCDIAVHQICYGVQNHPKEEWYCKKCVSKKTDIRCIFCPERGGAYKKVSGGRWGHVSCALWIPETSFGSAKKMEPIDSIELIPKKSWNQKCSLCKHKMGVCVTCSEEGCKTLYHVMCAQKRGLYIYVENSNTENVLFLSYCWLHSMKNFIIDYEKKHRIFGYKILTEEQLTKLMGTIRKNQRPRFKLPNIKLLEIVYQYWRMKRSHHPSSLLRRFQVMERGRLLGNTQLSEEEYYARFIKLRQDFERLRLLIDLVRKRELTKRDQMRVVEDITHVSFAQLHQELEQKPKKTKEYTPKRSRNKVVEEIEEELEEEYEEPDNQMEIEIVDEEIDEQQEEGEELEEELEEDDQEERIEEEGEEDIQEEAQTESSEEENILEFNDDELLLIQEDDEEPEEEDEDYHNKKKKSGKKSNGDNVKSKATGKIPKKVTKNIQKNPPKTSKKKTLVTPKATLKNIQSPILSSRTVKKSQDGKSPQKVLTKKISKKTRNRSTQRRKRKSR